MEDERNAKVPGQQAPDVVAELELELAKSRWWAKRWLHACTVDASRSRGALVRAATHLQRQKAAIRVLELGLEACRAIRAHRAAKVLA